MTQRLLVSVRGPLESVAAAEGGADLVDVTYPVSALGTPYPLNILAVRERLEDRGFEECQIASNIGARYADRASACQQAIGVARAGVDVARAGFAETTLEEAAYLGDSLVRTVRKWHSHTWVLPAGFVDKDMQRFFKPFEQGAELAADIDPDGLMIDTLNKAVDKGLLDYCSLADIADLADQLHAQQRQLWVAGGITAEELPALWDTGADVVCVRVAACAKTDKYGRFGEVDAGIVRRLTRTLPD